MNKPLTRLVIVCIAGLVIVGGVLAFYASARTKDLKKWEAEGTTKLENTDLYKQDREYFMQLYNHAKPLASKSVNGLLKAGVEEKDYYTALMTEMVRKAKSDNKVEVAQKLRTYATGRGWIGVTLD